MNKLRYITVVSIISILTSCAFEPHGEGEGAVSDGMTGIRFVTGAPEVVMTKAGDADGDQIENALVFVFSADGSRCLARQWSYIDEDKTMYMYLPSGQIQIYAVCNLLDPETVMSRVNSLADLEQEAVTVSDITGAYRGKYIMSGTTGEITAPGTQNEQVTIPVERIAASFDVQVLFDPVYDGDEFMVSSIALHNVPKGSWLLSRSEGDRTPEPASGYVLAKAGSPNDWTYSSTPSKMKSNYFEDGTLTMSGSDIRQGVDVSFSMFENRRGVFSNAESDLAVNWPDLDGRSDGDFEKYSQLWKRDLAQKAGMDEYSSYLTISGVYTTSLTVREVVYYVYLGDDNYASFDVQRNHKYEMTVTVRTVEDVDTRIDSENIGGLKVYYDDQTILDAHPNSVRTLLYAQNDWEMWVEDPDKTPWVELALSDDDGYSPGFLGSVPQAGAASFRVQGVSGMRYVYIHTDEYVPYVASPEENSNAGVRTAVICYRSGNSAEVSKFEVRQYPAQMVVLHIPYDVHTMKEVRDTFYVERVLEQRHMQWGFENHWDLTIDALIAAGQWDGLSNTRQLYQSARVEAPGAPDDEEAYPDGIPYDVGLRYVLEKNRDRDGDGEITYNEIMWYMPAINEMEAIYDALTGGLVTFEGSDDYFFSSTPSSSDPNGITTGYAYYIKMGSGKTGLARRTSEYNVIACRRANAWRGPEDAGGNGSVNIDDGWQDEDLIMPKPAKNN